MSSEGMSIGMALSNGIAAGIRRATYAIAAAASNAVTIAINSARNAAESHSPSKRSEREVGLPIMQGIAKAFTGNQDMLASTMRDVIYATIQPGDIADALASYRGIVHQPVQAPFEVSTGTIPPAFAGVNSSRAGGANGGQVTYTDNRTYNITVDLKDVEEIIEFGEFAASLDTERQNTFGRK